VGTVAVVAVVTARRLFFVGFNANPHMTAEALRLVTGRPESKLQMKEWKVGRWTSETRM